MKVVYKLRDGSSKQILSQIFANQFMVLPVILSL